MSSNAHTKEHSLANHTKKEMNRTAAIVATAATVHERESSPIQMAGQPIASSSVPIQHTTIHRSCLKHRPDGVDHHDKRNGQSNGSPQEDETGRLSAGGNHTTGRVSFAHAALSDALVLHDPLGHVQSDNPDLVEKRRRSALFAKKAQELRLAEWNYFKDHARDMEPTDE